MSKINFTQIYKIHTFKMAYSGWGSMCGKLSSVCLWNHTECAHMDALTLFFPRNALPSMMIYSDSRAVRHSLLSFDVSINTESRVGRLVCDRPLVSMTLGAGEISSFNPLWSPTPTPPRTLLTRNPLQLCWDQEGAANAVVQLCLRSLWFPRQTRQWKETYAIICR